MKEEQSYVLGIDVGGTKILTGLVARDGSILHCKHYPMNRTNQETTLASIRNAIDDYMKSSTGLPHPIAAGIGIVGKTDPVKGVWVSAVNLPVTKPVCLAEQIHKQYGLPASLDNDVHAAALAELFLGAGHEHNDFVYLNVGTGIAAGIISSGRLVRGSTNCAGEIGHMIVQPGGSLCKCGQHGCLEPLASGGDITAYVRSVLDDYPSSVLNKMNNEGKLTVTGIFNAADSSDKLASEIADRVVWSLGNAVINLMTLLDPELVVMGGGLFNGMWLYNRLCSYVQDKGGYFAKSADSLVLSKLNPDFVGLLGASCIAWQKIDRYERERNI
jgi:glucokinase